MNTTPQKLKSLSDNDKTPHNTEKVKVLTANLLTWYDQNKRILPWRAEPKSTTNPYHVWLSEIMLQQTQVKTVIPYFLKFVEKWPTVQLLASAEQNEIMEAWAGLGYYSRARNLHKCAKIIVSDFNGVFPNTIAELKSLPGIGDYTSAAIMSIAFNKPATVIDGNIERIISRLFKINEPIKQSKKIIKNYGDQIFHISLKRSGDLAQALMDLGSSICIPSKPSCSTCPISKICDAYKANQQENIPVKSEKKEKPLKHGYIYFVKNLNDEILLHRRPEKGMLGGTLGFPTSLWAQDKQNIKHLEIFELDLHIMTIQNNYKIQHSFTHFDLILTGILIENNTQSFAIDENEYFWEKIEKVNPDHFPSLFKKCIKYFI